MVKGTINQTSLISALRSSNPSLSRFELQTKKSKFDLAYDNIFLRRRTLYPTELQKPVLHIIKALRGKHKRNKEDLSTCSFVSKRTDSLCWGAKRSQILVMEKQLS